MIHKSGCIVCGNDLVYLESNKTLVCHYCNKEFDTNVKCTDGHYVCDSCHSISAMELIESFCKTTNLSDPLEMAIQIMEHPSVHMHGPEHHFLTAAVMIASYYKVTGQTELIENALQKARKRAELIPGGTCGTHGSCGAGVSSGIFISVITGSTPYAKHEWKLSNLMTGKSLLRIAESGGPRCCKRVSYQSILEAVKLVKEQLNINIPCNGISACKFFKHNKECLFTHCEFYRKPLHKEISIIANEKESASCCSGDNEFKTFFEFIKK